MTPLDSTSLREIFQEAVLSTVQDSDYQLKEKKLQNNT